MSEQPTVTLSLDQILELVADRTTAVLEPKVRALDVLTTELGGVAGQLEARFADMLSAGIQAGVSGVLERLEQLGLAQLGAPAPTSSQTQDPRPASPDVVIANPNPRPRPAAPPVGSPMARMSMRRVDGSTGRTVS
jgi:hypothetical protein